MTNSGFGSRPAGTVALAQPGIPSRLHELQEWPVRFYVGSQEYIEVLWSRERPGMVTVRSNAGSLAVHPHVTNVLDVELRR